MDIFIKSFNRPYYLEKCIHSIKRYVKGQYQIIVLDDGTDEGCLNKILSLYKEVIILKSPYYQEKVKAIQIHLSNQNNGMPKLKIPTNFWTEEIDKGTEYFLLLEDDMWLTAEINIADVEFDMGKYNLSLMKTTLLGIAPLEKYTTKSLNNYLVKIVPKLKIYNTFIFRKIYLENFLYSSSILQRLKLIDIRTVLPIYAIYMVAGCFFEKKYYNYIWQNYEGYVNENHQLYNVLKWHSEHPHKSYAILRKQSLNTSFISSATNKFLGINLDPFVYNDVLNRAWLDGRLNVTDSIEDFDEKLIEEILVSENKPSATFEEWKLWSQRFKAQYSFK